MKQFVLDNSVAMRWLLDSPKASDQQYALSVLQSLTENDAIVPNLWHLEAVNVLVAAEGQNELSAGEVEAFISQLEGLPIKFDTLTAHQAFSRILGMSRIYKLSSYDAAYLELAVREGLTIASLDKDLIKAAKKAGVDIYLR
jgi:predicted nucleic acid-binding protein